MFILCLSLVAAGGATAGVADFEDLSLAPDSYWNGSDGRGVFTSGPCAFNNNYDSTYFSWDGWAYSNTTDTTTSGWGNQYSAYTGSGHQSANYGVAYVSSWAAQPSTISLNSMVTVEGAYITNTTYAALSMLEGDSFAKKFGGATSDDPDWFKLTATGKNGQGVTTGTLNFYLADYRFSDNGDDYIVDEWTWVDFSSLGAVSSIEFAMSSSDVGDWGMNTPAYFAMDDITVAPEPFALVFFATGLVGVTGFSYRKRCRR